METDERNVRRIQTEKVMKTGPEWLIDRLEKARLVQKALELNDTPLFSVCLSGPDQTFRRQLTSSKQIGRGGFGTVYTIDIDGMNVIVKEALLNRTQAKLIKIANAKQTFISRNSWPEEYRLGKLVNDAIYTNECPNFPLTYELALCNNCVVGESGICYVSFVEPALGDLSAVVGNEPLPSHFAYSALYQLLIALYWLHFTYGIYHADIKRQNILVKQIPTGTSLRYEVNGINYDVENFGFLFMINDFGLSKSLKPDFASGTNFGTRNAYIDFDTGQLNPIRCEFDAKAVKIDDDGFEFKKVSNVSKFYWKDGRLGTKNHFRGDFDLNPYIPVDLNDTAFFPPFEFFLDIQDLIRMFVSGPKTTQHPHPGLNVPRNFKTRVSEFVKLEFPYDAESAKFLRADMIFVELFKPFWSTPRRAWTGEIVPMNVSSGGNREFLPPFLMGQ